MNLYKNNVESKNTSDIFFDDSSFFNNLSDINVQANTSCASINANISGNNSLLNISALCCDEEFNGFDRSTGTTWIYPTNYPIRDYQFNIIQAALTKNTLVSLPTGLGKTFIAAVIMYNFYRWYPLGKIIFMAPTRPLVAQQIDACYNIVAIPPNDTIEMTGTMPGSIRKSHWQEKRVIFATPQVISNDLKTGICPAKLVRCLVFDEAHKAKGNYAYCQIIPVLNNLGCRTFRVLALSATPGSKVEDVATVSRNLKIAHLELRSEHCLDVAPYSYSRQINTLVIPLGDDLTLLRQQYIEILDVYARRLKQLNILRGHIGNLSKGRIVILYKEFQMRDPASRHPQHYYIIKDFTILIALFHGLELMTKHGARVFLNFFDEHPEKSWIQKDDRLTALLERLRDDLGINPLQLNTSLLPDGTFPQIPSDINFGHPKFDKLRAIIEDHFIKAKNKGEQTKSIVFCEFRETVYLVHCLLLQCRPLILPQTFVGQGSGGSSTKSIISQKEQLRVMKNFRDGVCNTLVATSVAEEGLDVGNVDLIICFDISTKSPIRLVQRCGRTGRERGGTVYLLVTEGKEHQTLIDCMQQRDILNKRIMKSEEVKMSLYSDNPRMIPKNLKPKCYKMHVTVPAIVQKETKKKGGQADLRKMLANQKSKLDSPRKAGSPSAIITKEQHSELYPDGFTKTFCFDEPKDLWNMKKDDFIKEANETHTNPKRVNLCSWLEWQRKLQDTVNVKHSSDSRMLVELLQYADAKRFELPSSTQYPSYATQLPNTQALALPANQKMKKPAPPKKRTKAKSPTRKGGDIRALFSTCVKSTKEYTKVVNDLGLSDDGSVPTWLIDLMVDLSLEKPRTNLFDCVECRKEEAKPKTTKNYYKFPLELKLPDLTVVDKVTVEDIKKISAKRKMVFDSLEESMKNDHIVNSKEDSCPVNKIESLPAIGIKNNLIENIETDSIKDEEENIALLNDYIIEENVFSPVEDVIIDVNTNVNPKKLSDIINFDLDIEFENDDITTNEESNFKCDSNIKNFKNTEISSQFDLGDFEEIFKESDDDKEPLESMECKKLDTSANALEFFGLNSVEDIFADTSNDQTVTKKSHEKYNTSKNNECSPLKLADPQKTEMEKRSLSPVLFDNQEVFESTQCSPILCSQKKRLTLSTKKFDVKCSTPNAENNIKIAKVRPMLLAEKIDNAKDAFKDLNSDWTNINDATQENIPEKAFARQIKHNLTQDKSMFTVTQIVEMLNKTKCENNNISKITTPINYDDALMERSLSPILLSQARTVKNCKNVGKNVKEKSESLIILSSSCESDATEDYDLPLVEDKHLNKSLDNFDKTEEITPNAKRKSDEVNESPYFAKKPKLDVVSSGNTSQALKNRINLVLRKTLNENRSSQKVASQKENIPANGINFDDDDFDDFVEPRTIPSALEKLQAFKRKPSNVLSQRRVTKLSQLSNKDKYESSSEDEFETKTQLSFKKKKSLSDNSIRHKIRKKPKSKCAFIDDEAELSGSESGDEWCTQDSFGSIIDFICEENDQETQVDMQAHYLESLKNAPQHGKFKIPALPSLKYAEDVLSQNISEDEQGYEIDSFCVDGNVGLTQVQDVSELEIAERRLRKKRKEKRIVDIRANDSDVSPVIVKKKNVRRISSDSE